MQGRVYTKIKIKILLSIICFVFSAGHIDLEILNCGECLGQNVANPELAGHPQLQFNSNRKLCKDINRVTQEECNLF